MARLIAALLFLAVAAPAAAAPPVIASLDDAFIAHESGSSQWVIGSHDFSVVLGFDRNGLHTTDTARNETTGRAWPLTSTVAVTIGGELIQLGAGGVSLVGTEAIPTDYGVQLTFTFEHRASRARISRIYACSPGSPTIDTWIRIEAASDAPITLSDLNLLDFRMPPGTVRWLGGLRGDAADTLSETAFALGDHDLDAGERIEIGAQGRSTEQFVPFAMVDDGNDEFYGGVMWSGAWRIAFERIGDRLKFNAYFPGIETRVAAGSTFEFPHGFFGVKPRASVDDSGALRQFILKDLRHGRGFEPLVTYNTWFPYATRIDERVISRAIQETAALGAELFVIDAGWYQGAGLNGHFDFTTGLGTWAVDENRFPSGLGALADQAHALGMKFGIWVEPERVALDTVDQPGLARAEWLASEHGSIGSDVAGQLCLGTDAARRWLFNRLSVLIEQAHADYLKWDNNYWVNCDSDAHDHGPNDGNMAHVHGLYNLLGALRAKYPDLLIENVSGGGNRLDFGMLAYTDVAWMDDRSAPSSHVRHNLEGLTFAFPPAYLLSFMIDSPDEPIRGSPDPINIARSRMPGVLGLSYESAIVTDIDADVLARQIAAYKQIRSILANANATLLSNQAPVDELEWDVLQELTDDGRELVLFAFANSDDDARLVVKPRRLVPDATYDVRSIDAGPLGTATGAELMNDGIEIVHEAGSTRAHILIATAK